MGRRGEREGENGQSDPLGQKKPGEDWKMEQIESNSKALEQLKKHRISGKWHHWIILWGTIFLTACSPNSSQTSSTLELKPVSHAAFRSFVEATNYVTDAERYGWSFVQQDVFRWAVVENATWRRPDGLNPPTSDQFPVTQVSYNDAEAYCNWSGTRLPSYAEYWELIAADERKVITNYNGPISELDQVNTLGNVWEITATTEGDSIRLAGGSLFCSPTTCHGTSEARRLFVDKETGNIHIGFAVVVEGK